MLHLRHDYMIGIDRIDREHEILINLIMEFQNGWQGGQTKTQLRRHLEEIMLFARFHFQREENFMEDRHFPGLDDHRGKHSGLIESLSNIIIAFEVDSAQPASIQNFLDSWFFDHISNDDAKIAQFIRTHGGE